MQDKDGFSLVLAQRRGSEAVVILQSDFSAEGVQKIDEARPFVVASFTAVIDADGRFAVSDQGTLFDPLRMAPPGTACDKIRGQFAREAGAALLERMAAIRAAAEAAPAAPVMTMGSLPRFAGFGAAASALLVAVVAIGIV